MLNNSIKLFILDVDGVLTDGKIWYDEKGEEYKAFHTLDGVGLKRLQNAGVEIAVISGRNSPSVTRRMKELKITYVYQGVDNKLHVFQALLKELNITAQNAAYIGDDLPDIPIMEASGIAIAVHNAVSKVKSIAHYCTNQSGGQGAVREACEWMLSTQLVSSTLSQETNFNIPFAGDL